MGTSEDGGALNSFKRRLLFSRLALSAAAEAEMEEELTDEIYSFNSESSGDEEDTEIFFLAAAAEDDDGDDCSETERRFLVAAEVLVRLNVSLAARESRFWAVDELLCKVPCIVNEILRGRSLNAGSGGRTFLQ